MPKRTVVNPNKSFLDVKVDLTYRHFKQLKKNGHMFLLICSNNNCNYIWISKKKNPKCCPKCRQYLKE